MGYTFTGVKDTASSSELWAYNPKTNSWLKKNDFSGGKRYESFGFNVNDKGYLGMGFLDPTGIHGDMWQYDTTADSWKEIGWNTDFSGWSSVAFGIGNQAFIGTGVDSNGKKRSDFWSFSPYGLSIKMNAINTALKVYPNPAHQTVIVKIN